MTLIVYQIGDLPIYDHLRGKNEDGVTVSVDRSWRVPTKALEDLGGEIQVLPKDRISPEALSVNLKGEIFASYNLTTDYIINYIKSLGGIQNIPLIVFEISSQDNGTSPKIKFFYTEGTIDKTSGEFTYVDEHQISIDMKCKLYFQSLNPVVWEYRDFFSRDIETTRQTSTQNFSSIKNFPKTLDELKPGYFFFRWAGDDILNNPSIWKYLHINDPYGSYATDWGAPMEYYIYTFPYLWSGPPSSIYALTNLQTNDVITMQYRTPYNLFQDNDKVNQAVLNTDDVDSALRSRGYGGLRQDDIIVFGDVSPMPGLVLRGDVILEVVAPWKKTTPKVGQLARGVNQIVVNSLSSYTRFAQLHLYSRY